MLSAPYRKHRRGQSKYATALAAANGSAEGNGVADSRYRSLAQELLRANGSDNGHLHGKAVGIVGCETRDARSQVAADLAIQAACCTVAPVLLIDADERRRHVAKSFGLNGSPGWHEVSTGTADAASCVHAAKHSKLAVMTAGEENAPKNGAAADGANRSKLDDLKREYGLVVIDMPPASE